MRGPSEREGEPNPPTVTRAARTRCRVLSLSPGPRVLPCRRHTIEGSTEQWYECTEPSALDPTINCMLAPEWMGLEEGTWLCTDALKSEDKLKVASYSENSY